MNGISMKQVVRIEVNNFLLEPDYEPRDMSWEWLHSSWPAL